MSNDNKLLVGVHSDSLNEAIKNDKKVVDAFLECTKMKECLVLATPVSDTSVLSVLNPEIVRVSYEDRGDGTFVAMYKTGTYEGKTGFHDYIPSSMIVDLYGCKENSKEFNEIKGALLSLRFSRPLPYQHP